MRRYLWGLLINSVIASRLIPNPLRWRLYRLVGFDVERTRLFEGAWLSPNRPPIRIGAGTVINRGLTILDATRVDIGERCFIGPDVLIVTSTHHLGGHDHRAGDLYLESVTIGDGCWIGARATFLPGAHVPAGCIIAAGAVVNGTLEPDCIYGGVPAKLIRRLEA